MTRPVFRFAPSPTGDLHLGSAYSALFSWDAARAAEARFLLRIEDIDTERCRPEYEASMLDDLAWLGLEWEEPVRRQSEHLDYYAGMARKLDEMGLLYPCFASRKEITEAAAAITDHPSDPDGSPLYPGLCKGMSASEVQERKACGEPFALRLDMEAALKQAAKLHSGEMTFREIDASGKAERVAADPERWGDAVIARKGSTTSYHLSVVSDDALQGVTTITRGMDLYAATGLHRLLQILLGLPEPDYRHHPVLTDGQGRKLSKSHEDKSLASLRESGASPGEIRRLAGL